MATSTVTALPALNPAQIAGAVAWVDGANGVTGKLAIAQAATANTLVARDGSGNINVTAIVGVVNATTLTVSGTSTLTGAVTMAHTLSVTGVDGGGTAAFSGDFYNHAMVTVGYIIGGGQQNTLSSNHQVGVLVGLQGNANALGVGSFVSGIETQVGTLQSSGTVDAIACFQAGAIATSGATITCTRGLGTHDETVGANNAAIADNGTVFAGNWFIYYPNARASWLGGALTVVGQMTTQHDLKFDDANAGHGLYSTNNTRVLAVYNAGVSIPNVTGAIALAGTATFAVAPVLSAAVALTITAGDIQMSSNAGFGLLSANATRIIGITNSGTTLTGTATVTGAFGCNGATARTSATFGVSLAAYVTGGFGLDSDAHMLALYNKVVAIDTALKNNGIATV